MFDPKLPRLADELHQWNYINCCNGIVIYRLNNCQVWFHVAVLLAYKRTARIPTFLLSRASRPFPCARAHSEIPNVDVMMCLTGVNILLDSHPFRISHGLQRPSLQEHIPWRTRRQRGEILQNGIQHRQIFRIPGLHTDVRNAFVLIHNP